MAVDLSKLNKAQRESVECIEGASLIMAGAGSGKTRVLTYKIAYLLDSGIAPESILALTFTNKAAKEMNERISSVVGLQKARKLMMGTFHSVFSRFLREYAELIGFPKSYTIYDASDARSAIKACIKELELDEKMYSPKDVASRISLAKNNLVRASVYASSPLVDADKSARKPRICDIYALYEKKNLAAGVMDFDDILLYMNVLLRDHPEVGDILATRFKYILVDEYQDTNMSQYLIIKRIASKNGNISVVGDDSQSIYGFRGARVQNILNFKKDFPNAKEFKLEQNYRSTQTIVNAANSVIVKNTNRLKKECYSQQAIGEKIELYQAFNEQDEANAVAASIIKKVHASQQSYDDFAILYRTNTQSRAIEDALRKRNLPYKIYKGHAFYERAEIKDILAYLRLILNHKDDEALKRIINVPVRGIGTTTKNALIAAATNKSLSIWEAVMTLSPQELGIKQAVLDRVQAFTSLLEGIKSKLETENAYNIALEAVNATGYLHHLSAEGKIESLTKEENIKELLDSISVFIEEREVEEKELGNDTPFISLSQYMENVALLTDMDAENQESDDKNKIKLMTIHSSKGLEFAHTYIIGVEENIFPSMASNTTPEQIEEERRLFYVALTRAMTTVYLSCTRSRFRFGSYVNYPPSRFLKEIDPQYLSTTLFDSLATPQNAPQASNQYSSQSSRFASNRSNNSFNQYQSRTSNPKATPNSVLTPTPRPRPVTHTHSVSANFVESPIGDLAVGQKVEHSKFGFGTIMELVDENQNSKAVIEFDQSGKRVLLLKFAKLRIV